MFKKGLILAVVLAFGAGNGAGASEFSELKVDLALRDCGSGEVMAETAKPGWWHWVGAGWSDLYSHDMRWEDGGGTKPTDSGIAGSGVHAGITLILEGDGGLKVSGLTMCNLNASCGCPYGVPIHDAICNSWYQAVDWPEFAWGSIQLALHDLPAGAYTLYSYHNHFGCYRLPETDDGTPVNCDCVCDASPAMPIIRGMSVLDARSLPYQQGDSFTKLFPGVDWDTGPFSRGVVSIQDACNVQIQQVTTDDELVPSVIRFQTDGSAVLVLYKAGCCESDPVRPGRVGGRGILNAFRLVRSGEILYAFNPSPGDGDEGLPDVTLSWSPAYAAVLHDVYLGTDFNDVNDANTSETMDVYMGRQDACEYNPAVSLELGRTYYWRIDEVNEAYIPLQGMVWSFTLKPFVLDDMEDYNDTNNKIYDTWIDGWRNGTGSAVGLGTDPCDPVHSPEQSMKYYYDSSGGLWDDLHYYSETVRTITDPCDWTVCGVKALTLYFYGHPDNDANATERMYVGLEDGSGPASYAQVNYGDNGEDVNDVKLADWQEWNIRLQDFNDGGVNLPDVNNIYIGFGIRGNLNPGGTPGGWGLVYFDDIRLYLPRCVPWLAKPIADFGSDCLVSFEDFAILGDQWMQPPGSPSADIAPEVPDGVVDWLDLDAFAEAWLKEELWPPQPAP
jgi:hypothetical protein